MRSFPFYEISSKSHFFLGEVNNEGDGEANDDEHRDGEAEQPAGLHLPVLAHILANTLGAQRLASGRFAVTVVNVILGRILQCKEDERCQTKLERKRESGG